MAYPNTALSKELQHNRLDEAFFSQYQQIINAFFSRDAVRWPLYGIPEIRHLMRQRQVIREGDPGAGCINIHGLFGQQAVIPHHSRMAGLAFDSTLAYVAGNCKDWDDPTAVENVITAPCDPAIHGAMMATIVNPNLVYSEYAGMAADLEKHVIKQIAALVGYDPDKAAGIFTQGGTFCNLYGYLMGLRKSMPNSLYEGMGSTGEYRMINSQGGHYSNITNLSLLGVDVNNRTIRIRMSDSNNIDIDDLEYHLRHCFAKGIKVPTIMLTFGTTDTFAVDDISSVYLLREKLCREYEVPVKPHIHVDAAVGWSMLFFREYDFSNNPLAINPATLEGIYRLSQYAKALSMADSFTVDFQKWGFVPYTSSLVMVKNGVDLSALKHDQQYFTYFEPELQNNTHLKATIECSRGAVGLFSAYSAMQYLGVEGYQTLIAHGLQNANYLRMRLNELGNCHVVAPENQGPSVAFRMYDPAKGLDPEETFARELDAPHEESELDKLVENSLWHREHFLARRGQGLKTNWVTSIAHTHYDSCGSCSCIPGEKAVFMNPKTGREHIDAFVQALK